MIPPITPAANRFLNDLQRHQARTHYAGGATIEAAAQRATALARSFAAAMRDGTIAELDGEPVLALPAPAPPARRLAQPPKQGALL